MHPAQPIIQKLLDRLCAEGRERGIQVAVYREGELVVNAWAGLADANTGIRVGPETLFPVFSVTKGMVATIIHLLAERGQLSYDMPVASVWPEFGGQGKEDITVRQILNHTAGVSRLPAGIGAAELCNWAGICRQIAQQSPLWPPGSRCEYHGMTYGWILGEVARRVDGRDFSRLLQDEICRPLGITTMFAGLPERFDAQVARLEAADAVVAPDDGLPQVVPFSVQPLHVWMNRLEVRRACIPASNGIMNALALARHYAALLPGRVDGVELLPPKRVRLATERQQPVQPDDPEFCKGRGLGFQIGQPGSVMGESADAFGHGGHGGATGFADRSLGLAVGLTRNYFHADDPAREIVAALRRGLRTET